MTALVIDASIAIKWVVEEAGTPEALTLKARVRLAAPDLLVPECANILWKKVQRKELARDEALIAARLIAGADIELFPMRALCEPASRLAIDTDHPAYDCMYLALAEAQGWALVTADQRLLRKLRQADRSRLKCRVLSLAEAASQGRP